MHGHFFILNDIRMAFALGPLVWHLNLIVWPEGVGLDMIFYPISIRYPR